jgi:hypothetical protein
MIAHTYSQATRDPVEQDSRNNRLPTTKEKRCYRTSMKERHKGNSAPIITSFSLSRLHFVFHMLITQLPFIL